MNRKLLSLVTPFICACALAAMAPAAGAQKGVLGTGGDPFAGVADPDGGFRYTAIQTVDGTVLQKIDIGTGQIEAFRHLNAQLIVPAVAYDYTAGGLSADGETLVLARPGWRFPQLRSEFVIVDTRRLRTLDRVTFDGTFTYDALSPDGGSLFLVEYTHPRDLTEYVVREYDLVRDRFNPDPIIDPNEEAEEMYGSPVTRVTSPNGRWEYTLYDGREHPFIHALDTARAKAVCIDLESLHNANPYGGADLSIDPGGTSLTVTNKQGPVETVDTRTFEVEPAAPPADNPPAPPAAAEAGGDGGFAWIVLAGGLMLLVAATGLLVRRRRDDPVGETELERLVGIGNGAGPADSEREPERDPVA